MARIVTRCWRFFAVVVAAGAVWGLAPVALAAAQTAFTGEDEDLPIEVVEVRGPVGLYPGARGDLIVVVRNAADEVVVVTGIPSTVQPSDVDRCAVGNVRVESASGLSVAVAPDAHVEIVVRDAVSMRRTAGDGCQGQHFAIAVRIESVPAA